MNEDPFDLRPGALVERCRVVQCLGNGRFGTVYEARESPLGTRLALYMIRRSLLNRPDGVDLFERQARAFASVRHSHLAETRPLGRHMGVPYFLSELPDAETLHVKLARVGGLPVSLLVDLTLPVLSALTASHRSNVRLRLMPQGVFLVTAEDGVTTPRVVAFAITEALVPGAHRGATGAPAEVLPFLSPEEARGSAAVDVRSDVWSVGATLYTAATGRRPFDEGSREATLAAMLTRTPRPPREHRPALPEAFEAVVLKALASDPAARFASAVELGQALLPFATVGQRARWSGEFGGAATSVQPARISTKPPPAMGADTGSMRPVPLTPAALTLADRRARLRRVPLFAELSPSDIEALLASVRWRSLSPGDALYRQGETGDTMAFIAEGAVVVCVTRVGTQHEVARLGVGDVLGEMACLDPAPRSASVIATGDVLVGELSRDGLDALSEHAPGIASLIVGEVIRNVAAKVREMDERIEALLAPPSERASQRPPSSSEAPPAEAGEGAAPPSGRPRPSSGVWRFVDYLRKIT